MRSSLVIPIEESNLYPYRYDEWDYNIELKMVLADITYKYNIVNLSRLLRYRRLMDYDQVIFHFSNYTMEWNVENLFRYNIDGAKNWAHYTINDEIRRTVAERCPQLGGLFTMRLRQMKEVKKSFVDELKKLVPSSPDFDKKCYKFDVYYEKLCKLAKTPRYIEGRMTALEFLENIYKKFEPLNDRYSKYDWKIIDGIASEECINKIKKEEWDYSYKKNYWTCLDILIYGLEGNLSTDIDGDYWRLMGYLENDSRFEKVGDFIFMEKGFDSEVVEKEAKKIQLVQDTREIKLNPKLLKPLTKGEINYLNTQLQNQSRRKNIKEEFGL